MRDAHKLRSAIPLCLALLLVLPGRAVGQAHAPQYTVTDLGTLGGLHSHGLSINDAGQVVGGTATAAGEEHAFLYSGGVMTDLGTLGGMASIAYAINNAGQVVGSSPTAAGEEHGHAFLYSDGVMTDLNALIPANSGYVLAFAYDINDRGQILVGGTVNGEWRALVLTPAPPVPAQISNLADLVRSYGLQDGIGISLTAKLDAALAAYDAGDAATACAELTAFINQADALSGRKLTAQQAADLIAAATRIKAAVGCP